MKTIIKCIELNDELPKGFSYLTSWKCEELLCNNFGVFGKLKKFEYYKLVNKTNNKYLWLGSLVYYSYIYCGNWGLYYNNRVRGVLIIKEE